MGLVHYFRFISGTNQPIRVSTINRSVELEQKRGTDRFVHHQEVSIQINLTSIFLQIEVVSTPVPFYYATPYISYW